MMTNEERLHKTIRFERTDKILSGPSIAQFAATYAGITQKEFADYPLKAEEAYEKTFTELGGWDVGRPFIGGRPGAGRGSGPAGFAMGTMRPGRELADNSVVQFIEREIMVPEDYDFVIENGYNALQKRLSERANPPSLNTPSQSPEEQKRAVERDTERIKANTAKWDARGVVRLSSGNLALPPFDFFSIHRSVAKFPMDIRRMPDKVKAATKACMPDIIANAKKSAETSGCRRVGTASSRSSSTFISNKQFEEFVLPTWLEFVWAMADADLDIIFHCDCDWTRFLPYFKEFPAKRCVLQLDGASDIFKAKEILEDHMALHGDVPAPLLTLGTPEEVYAYCKKLIEVIGEGGGFILSSGCSTPSNAKIGNVRAMVRAGNELTWV
ncbi:MAG: uroporphyrinogen decarboxylase family protein [Chloroflexota bacterium]